MRRTLPLLVAAVLAATDLGGQTTWRGLVVQPERRCSPYDPDDYSYPQSLEASIVRQLGGVYSPYTGERFGSTRETDIEHMVARSEAHDSGLCGASLETRLAFARDLMNLTLASPSLNRGVKGANDAAEWMPRQNRCWFADRVVRVRRRWGLSIDVREARALDEVLARCPTTPFEPVGPEDFVPLQPPGPEDGRPDALRLWDDDGNGRITCAEARRHGIAPVPRGHLAYRFMRDGDGDGVVCESRVAGARATLGPDPHQSARPRISSFHSGLSASPRRFRIPRRQMSCADPISAGS